MLKLRSREKEGSVEKDSAAVDIEYDLSAVQQLEGHVLKIINSGTDNMKSLFQKSFWPKHVKMFPFCQSFQDVKSIMEVYASKSTSSMAEVDAAAGDDKGDEDDFDMERDNFIPIIQQTIDSTKVESDSTGTAESGH
eukprot:3744208-Ditylum_brightwellii.AAC.1